MDQSRLKNLTRQIKNGRKGDNLSLNYSQQSTELEYVIEENIRIEANFKSLPNSCYLFL